jgi:UDP-N-acetylglucosamine:LPS N-acetylglucosamine transferase
MKICLTASGGGHLTEISFLEPFYKKYNHFFVTFERPNSLNLAKKERVYFIIDPKRSPLKVIKNLIQSIKIIIRERPDVIISTGAGVAVPICYLGKILGSKIIFIESFCRVYDPAFSSRLVYPIADLFIVQWKRLLDYYPNSVYGGTLI